MLKSRILASLGTASVLVITAILAVPMILSLPDFARAKASPGSAPTAVQNGQATFGKKYASRGQKRRVKQEPARPLLSVVDHTDITPRHRALADSTLRALPSSCRDHLKNFYVSYESMDRRGFGGATSMIIVGNAPDSEFRALIVHECGHIVDLGALRGSEQSGQTPFFDGNEPIFADDPSIGFYRISWETSTKRKEDSKASHFLSGYGATDSFEDFAETFAFYALQYEEFQRLAKHDPVLGEKFAWMRDSIFGETKLIAQGSYRRAGSHPSWDVTKLPYAWSE